MRGGAPKARFRPRALGAMFTFFCFGLGRFRVREVGPTSSNPPLLFSSFVFLNFFSIGRFRVG